jgi:hypothetical protein
LAKLKILREHGSNARYVLACAKKTNRYGHKNRKGILVVHAGNIYNDQNAFEKNKIIEDRIQGVHFDDPYDATEFFIEQSERFISEGPHHMGPLSLEEELELQREFLESL